MPCIQKLREITVSLTGQFQPLKEQKSRWGKVISVKHENHRKSEIEKEERWNLAVFILKEGSKFSSHVLFSTTLPSAVSCNMIPCLEWNYCL